MGRYKRYKLAEAKTFKSLFFPQKEAVLKLLDQFTAKEGKFAIPGFPHKLWYAYMDTHLHLYILVRPWMRPPSQLGSPLLGFLEAFF